MGRSRTWPYQSAERAYRSGIGSAHAWISATRHRVGRSSASRRSASFQSATPRGHIRIRRSRASLSACTLASAAALVAAPVAMTTEAARSCLRERCHRSAFRVTSAESRVEPRRGGAPPWPNGGAGGTRGGEALGDAEADWPPERFGDMARDGEVARAGEAVRGGEAARAGEPPRDPDAVLAVCAARAFIEPRRRVAALNSRFSWQHRTCGTWDTHTHAGRREHAWCNRRSSPSQARYRSVVIKEHQVL